MTPSTHTEPLADAARQLVNGTDIADLLARLVRNSASAMHADAVGLLLRSTSGGLELLASTSHRVAELELFQVQTDSGPCIDAIAAAAPVSAVGRAKLIERWPTVGETIVAAGYSSVHAFPLVWRGRVLGGLNVFTTSEQPWDGQQMSVGQTFADVSTLAVVHLPELSDAELAARIDRALAGRVVIERAKGVLAHVHDISTDEAYDRLTQLATERGATLTVTAQGIIDAAARRTRDESAQT